MICYQYKQLSIKFHTDTALHLFKKYYFYLGEVGVLSAQDCYIEVIKSLIIIINFFFHMQGSYMFL